MPRLPDVTAYGERPVPVDPITSTKWSGTKSTGELAGRGLNELGAAMQKLSRDIENENARFDTVVSEDAFNKVLAKKLELTRGENGYQNRRGEDAANKPFIEEYTKQFDDAVSGISDGLSNGRQKQMLKRRADLAGLDFKQGMLGHATREREVYEKDTIERGIQTRVDNAVQNYENPVAIKIAKSEIAHLVGNYWESRGYRATVGEGNTITPHPVVADIIRNAESRINRLVIERHLTNDQDGTAAMLFKEVKNAKGLTAEDTVALERTIDVSSTRGEARKQVDYAIKKFKGDERQVLDYLNNLPNTKVADAAATRYKTRISEDAALEKIELDKPFTAALGTIEQTGDFDKIDPVIMAQIPADDRKTLEMRAKQISAGESPKHDPAKWNEFNRVYDDRRKLANISEREFARYLFSFDDEHRNRASQLRDAARDAAKGDPKAKELLRNDVNLKRLVLGKVVEAGLIDARKKTADYTQEDETILSESEAKASSILEKMQMEKGRKATVDEERAVVNSLVLDKAKARIKGSGWTDPVFGTTWGEKKKPVSEMTAAEKQNMKFDYKAVPITKRDQIKARAAGLGVDTSGLDEDRIAEAYTAFMAAQNNGLSVEDAQARVDAILRRK